MVYTCTKSWWHSLYMHIYMSAILFITQIYANCDGTLLHMVLLAPNISVGISTSPTESEWIYVEIILYSADAITIND